MPKKTEEWRMLNAEFKKCLSSPRIQDCINKLSKTCYFLRNVLNGSVNREKCSTRLSLRD